MRTKLEEQNELKQKDRNNCGSIILIESILSDPDYLVTVSENIIPLIIGVLIALIDCVAFVGIAVLMFPILKKHNEPVALGYIGTRIAELVIILVYLIPPLLLITLSQEYVKAGASDASNFQTLGAVLQAERYWVFRLIYILNGVASLTFCYLLYKSKLVPRFLSVWGLIGGAVILIGTSVDMFGLIDVNQGAGMIVVLPLGLFELILPIWLFVKGFNSSAIASESAKTDIKSS
jgi:hypothetical protein